MKCPAMWIQPTCHPVPWEGCWVNLYAEDPSPPFCRMMAFGGGLEFVPRWCLPRRLG